ncbi:MAG: hypothetical protein WBD55_08195 [Dehalococcoidia bacterium]
MSLYTGAAQAEHESARGGLGRHSRDNLCPVCGGHPALPQHRGVRCAGFTLDRVTYCTRDEHAGSVPLDITKSPPAYKHRLFGWCDCGTQHGWRSATNGPAAHGDEPRRETPPIDERHAIYSHAIDLLELRSPALADLTRRGLSSDAAHAAGYRSLPCRGTERSAFLRKMIAQFGEERLRRCPGFTDKNSRLGFWSTWPDHDGYIVPYQNEEGRSTGLQVKYLGGKYLTARGARLAEIYHVSGLDQAAADLYVTEGATKANVASHLAGVWIFALAGQALFPEHIEAIRRLGPARVIVALDQEDNANTDRAREHWLRALYRVGLPVHLAVWEGGDVGGPKGLDDLFLAGGRPRIRRVHFPPPEIGQRRTPRQTLALGPVAQGTTIAEARLLTSRAVGQFVTNAARNAGKALLVRTPPGAGKTTAAGQAIQRARMPARVLVGTTRLAREVAAEFGYAPIAGRHEDNCERIDVVRSLGEAGHDVERLACGTREKPRCPARDACAYWRQFESVGARVGAAEQLFNLHFLRGGKLLVIDDADLLRSLIARHRLDREVLARSLEQLRGKRRLPARRLLTIVEHAVTDAPRREDGKPGPALFGSAVWDHLTKTARRYDQNIAELIEALPESGTLPKPGERKAKGSVLEVEDIAATPPATILSLFEALREELPAFERSEPFNSRIRLDAAGVEVLELKRHVTNHEGETPAAEMAMLVLEATPVDALVDHLTSLHERLPDVAADVRLPESVTVVQYATSTNGHVVLRDEQRMNAVLVEVAAERERFPVAGSNREAAVCFRDQRDRLLELGFAESQVLTFGGSRGLNAVADVERLHVVGRPMPPGDDLVFLAQALHHGEEPISGTLLLAPRGFGDQRYEVDVVDFADPRVSALLRATRDDEITQVIHRARLLMVEEQQPMLDGTSARRSHVRLVLHTNHALPGLRVDELRMESKRRDVNEERHQDAELRISLAVEELRRRGERLTVTGVAKAAGANKATVTKVLGTPVHTPKRDLLNKGMNHVPQTGTNASSPTRPPLPLECLPADADGRTPCRGGCGKLVPRCQKCSECATKAVAAWKRAKLKRTG